MKAQTPLRLVILCLLLGIGIGMDPTGEVSCSVGHGSFISTRDFWKRTYYIVQPKLKMCILIIEHRVRLRVS